MKKCKKYCEEGCGALKLALIITGSIVAAAGIILLLLKLFKRKHVKLPCDCCFSFTVQEEVGCFGGKTAAYTLRPDIAIAVETTTAGVSSPEATRYCASTSAATAVWGSMR